MPEVNNDTKAKPIYATFVIVCWNNRELLEECLDTITKQTYKWHRTIVVDNGSTDDSVKYIRDNHPDVTLIETGKNSGFAIGNNIGIERALKDKDCAYIALLNTDARLDPNWLEVLIGFAKDHPHSASLQAPTVDYFDHKKLDSRGITLDHQGRAMQLGHREDYQPLQTKRVFGVNAAAALYTRSFLEVQPFGTDYLDSDMWMYLEDVDIAARASVMGWENWLVAGSLGYHMGSASSSSNPGFSIYRSYRNNVYMILKNMPFSIILRLIPGMIFTDLQSYYRHVRGKNYIAIKSMLRARAYSMTHFGVYLRKRRELKKHRGISTKALWQLMGDA